MRVRVKGLQTGMVASYEVAIECLHVGPYSRQVVSLVPVAGGSTARSSIAPSDYAYSNGGELYRAAVDRAQALHSQWGLPPVYPPEIQGIEYTAECVIDDVCYAFGWLRQAQASISVVRMQLAQTGETWWGCSTKPTHLPRSEAEARAFLTEYTWAEYPWDLVGSKGSEGRQPCENPQSVTIVNVDSAGSPVAESSPPTRPHGRLADGPELSR